MLLLSLHLKLYSPSEKTINYFTSRRQAPETPKTEGNIFLPLITRACTHAHTQVTRDTHIHMHSYKTYTLTHIYLYLHRQYMSMLYKLQDKNFLEEELNVLHGRALPLANPQERKGNRSMQQGMLACLEVCSIL